MLALLVWQLHLCHIPHDRVVCHPIGVPQKYERACSLDQLAYKPKVSNVWTTCKALTG